MGFTLGRKSDILTAAGVLIVILAIIMMTNIRLSRVTLFDRVVILVVIFGGAGILAYIFFQTDTQRRRNRCTIHG